MKSDIWNSSMQCLRKCAAAICLGFLTLSFARAPMPLPYTEWNNSYCKEHQNFVHVATTELEWQSLWSKYGSEAPHSLPQNSKVMGIFMGTKPTGGYGVRVDDVKRQSTAVQVEYHFYAPSKNEFLSEALTSPCMIILVKTDELPLTAYRLAKQ